MEDSFTIKGHLDIIVTGPDGKVKQRVEVKNTVTSDGLAGVMDQLLDSPTLPKAGWMELGTGSAITSKHLQTYIANSRHAVDTPSRDGAVVTFSHTWAAGEATNAAITEAGLFDVVTQNTANAWCYTTFTAVNKGAADALQIVWTLTIS